MNLSREVILNLLDTAQRQADVSRALVQHLQVCLIQTEARVEELQKQLQLHQASRCASINSYAIAQSTSISF